MTHAIFVPGALGSSGGGRRHASNAALPGGLRSIQQPGPVSPRQQVELGALVTTKVPKLTGLLGWPEKQGTITKLQAV